MHRLHTLVGHLDPPPVSARQQADQPSGSLHTHDTSLRHTLQTQSPLIQQLDRALNTAVDPSSPSTPASPALPANLSPAAWLALPPHTLVGSSASLAVTQQHIDAFAAVTGDAQWIHSHLAPSLGSPFSRPIAHGFLVLSLLTPIVADVLPIVDGQVMTVNYGLERVRWMRPVGVDDKLVGTVWLESAEQLKGGVIHSVLKVEVRVVGADGESGREREASNVRCVAGTLLRTAD